MNQNGNPLFLLATASHSILSEIHPDVLDLTGQCNWVGKFVQLLLCSHCYWHTWCGWWCAGTCCFITSRFSSTSDVRSFVVKVCDPFQLLKLPQCHCDHRGTLRNVGNIVWFFCDIMWDHCGPVDQVTYSRLDFDRCCQNFYYPHIVPKSLQGIVKKLQIYSCMF